MTGALAPYRVLDLTTHRGWLTGKMLADLGADVVKVEPPGGDPGRRLGPFAGDDPHPENSLRWRFYNRGKRSVTLNLDTADGRALLLSLAGTAHVLLESFDPGHLAARGLGFGDLDDGRLVYTSITPFGQTGPHAGHHGPDIVLGAAGGQMYLTGDGDRPPVRIGAPQFELHGAAEAAVHTTVALYSGRGQHVDVATQLAVIRTLMNAASWPQVTGGADLARGGSVRAGSTMAMRMIYRCKDGYITSMLSGIMGIRQLLGWMEEEGGAPEWLKEFDWESTDFGQLMRSERGPEFFRRAADSLEEFFANHTKQQLYEGALKRRLLMAPVHTVMDIRSDPQLAAREYFQEVDGVAHAGPWAKLSATPLVDTPRAPRIGEHNADILGLSPDELTALSAAGVV